MYWIARQCVLPALSQEQAENLLTEAAVQSLAQVFEAVPPFGLSDQRRRQHLLRDALDMLPKIDVQHVVGGEVAIHPLRGVQLPKLALEHQPIKPTQDTQDKSAKTL